MTRRKDSYAPPNSFDKDDQLGEWRNLGMPTSNLFELTRGQAHNYSESAKDVRNEFREYFVSSRGDISWQYKHI